MLNASTVSGIIARLQVKGLVAKLPNQKDKRGALITLTAKGAVLLESTPGLFQEKFSRRIEALSPEMLQSLSDNIDLLIEIMGPVREDVEGIDTI